MRKVLFVASVVKAHIMLFHIPYLKWFKENGYETYVCARNDYENEEECNIPFCDHYFNLPFERNPLKLNNVKAYKKLRDIINSTQFQIIHCHTPIGGVITRIAACKSRNTGAKLIYTAHGFHFFKGAPVKNWVLYYPIELILSKYTDVLITINKEDYEIARKYFNASKVVCVPGVGIDVKRVSEVVINKSDKCKELNVPVDAFILLSVGELNKNKNHETVIRAMKELNNSQIHYIICGQGQREDYLKKMVIELGLDGRVHFVGFRKDIIEICKIADVFVFLSIREGLSLALMEAMASGLSVVASMIRGNLDLIDNGKGGYLINPTDENRFVRTINQLFNSGEQRKLFGEYNILKVKDFSIEVVQMKMESIYKNNEGV